MKILLLCLCLTSCQTVLYGNNGSPLVKMQSDLTNVRYSNKTQGIDFRAEKVSNSAPIIAAGKTVSGVATATGAAITPILLIP